LLQNSANEDSERGFSVHNEQNLRFPLLLSVPHAGRNYSREIIDNLAVPAINLLRLEDRYADRLTVGAISSGFTTMIAHQPRAWIDLNRERTEIDPDMIVGLSSSHVPQPGRKVRGGLGIVPRRLSGVGNLWRDKWSKESLKHRLDSFHEPYHQNIENILGNMQSKFGCAILLDLHSMPPLDGGPDNSANIVIGDRFGRSAGSRYSELAVRFFEQEGYQARLNHPYSGGYILERHSDPDREIHALQLEVDRSCYLDAALREPSPNLPVLADKILNLARLLTDQALSQFQLAAAE